MPYAFSYLLQYVFYLSHFHFSSFILALLDTQMEPLCQVGPIAGAPIDPPQLPWSFYAYGLDGFTHERVVGRNTNVMGYPFLKGTRAVSSLPLIFLLLLSFPYISSSLVLTSVLFHIQSTVQEHEELVQLARNFKLELTKYSRQSYGPRGFAT